MNGNLEKCFEAHVTEIGEVDLWIQDSNYGYLWQAYEYLLASRDLTTYGVLVSDDIESSTAWGLGSKDFLGPSSAIFDNRNFIGVAKIRT